MFFHEFTTDKQSHSSNCETKKEEGESGWLHLTALLTSKYKSGTTSGNIYLMQIYFPTLPTFSLMFSNMINSPTFRLLFTFFIEIKLDLGNLQVNLDEMLF